MRYIGIDYGDSRIGIALSDPLGLIASPDRIIDSSRSRKKIIFELCDLIREKEVKTAVVGYPRNMNGTEGARVEVTNSFCEDLRKRCPDLTIVKWDERLTSVAADRAMREMNVSQSHKGVNDMLAAVFILQGYLDSLRNEKKEENQSK